MIFGEHGLVGTGRERSGCLVRSCASTSSVASFLKGKEGKREDSTSCPHTHKHFMQLRQY